MATLSTSYAVESGVKTTLKNTISPTITTGIKLNYALTITSGVLRFDPDTSREEYISFGGASVSSGVTTLSDVVRNLSKTLNDFSGSGTGFQHSGGACIVELTNYHALYNLKANTDRANTWLADQTIATGIKLYFGDTNQYVYSNGTELFFRSSLQAERSLSQLASLSGSNDKVKNSASDTTEGYLSAKITTASGSGLTKTTNNPAGNEDLGLAIQLESLNPTLQISSNQLGIKIKSAGGLAVDSNGTYVDVTILSGIVASALGSNLTYDATITAKDAVYWKGNQRVDKTDADAVNTAFLFAGVANASGVQGDSKQVIHPGPVVTVNAFTLSDRQNCRLWPGQTQASSNTTSDALSASTTWRAQTFTPGTNEDNMSTVVLNLTKIGSPTGNCTIRIRATTGGVPSGSDLATATLAYSAISLGDNTFTISGGLTVTPGTVYAIILDPGAGVSGGNTIAWNYQNTNVYASGQRCTSSDSGSNWTGDSTADYRFTVNYRGISGEPVYVSNTAGALSLTPGTYNQIIGYAVNASQIMLQPRLKSIYGSFTASVSTTGTVDTEVTLGFRPSIVILMAGMNQTATRSYPTGTLYWHNASTPNTFGLGLNQWSFTGGDAALNEDTAPVTSLTLKRRDVGNTVSETCTVSIQSAGADSVTIRRNTTLATVGFNLAVRFIAIQ